MVSQFLSTMKAKTPLSASNNIKLECPNKQVVPTRKPGEETILEFLQIPSPCLKVVTSFVEPDNNVSK